MDTSIMKHPLSHSDTVQFSLYCDFNFNGYDVKLVLYSVHYVTSLESFRYSLFLLYRDFNFNENNVKLYFIHSETFLELLFFRHTPSNCSFNQSLTPLCPTDLPSVRHSARSRVRGYIEVYHALVGRVGEPGADEPAPDSDWELVEPSPQQGLVQPVRILLLLMLLQDCSLGIAF